MKWLLDAQLPRRLAELFVQRGHEATHTLELPAANASSDEQLLDVAAIEDRVIVTKDADFVNSFWLTERPRRLLLVSTGNIGNRELTCPTEVRIHVGAGFLPARFQVETTTRAGKKPAPTTFVGHVRTERVGGSASR